MVLGRWLLDQGANPNDAESLYHATDLGHHEGLKMLLDFGADPTGTNALLRAMDFHDHAAVQMLLESGARADDFNSTPLGGEDPWGVPVLPRGSANFAGRADVADFLTDWARTHPGQVV